MTSRRKGTPCACNTDPCSCGSSRGCVRAVNNVSPDPNGDLVIRGGQGIEVIQSGDDLVINNTANPNAFVAGNNIEFSASGDNIAIDLTDEPVVDGLTVNGDTQLNGDLEVNGDIIQNGAAYETHAEHIYSRDDYIIMRDGAIAALAPGDYAGFKVKLYDGVNDGALVIDNSGTARVGDVGDEQPLLTRDEAADLTNGNLLEWDGTNQKAIDSGIKPFTPLTITTYSYQIGVYQQATGYLTYTRTGYKKGKLSGLINIATNTDSAHSAITNLSNLANIFGISFTASSKLTGSWCLPNNDANSYLYGYGTVVQMHSNGEIALARAYQLSGTYGQWELDDFSGVWVRLDDIELDEV